MSLALQKYIVYRHDSAKNKGGAFKVEEENETSYKILSPDQDIGIALAFALYALREKPEIRYIWVAKNSPDIYAVFTCRDLKSIPA